MENLTTKTQVHEIFSLHSILKNIQVHTGLDLGNAFLKSEFS
jgi:hypothetical protein